MCKHSLTWGSCGSWRGVRGSCWPSPKWLLYSTEEIKEPDLDGEVCSLEPQEVQRWRKVKSRASSALSIYRFVCEWMCDALFFFLSGPSACRQQQAAGGRNRQHRPHANSLKLDVSGFNTPSSKRTFLCHCGRAGSSGRAGVLPSHYWTKMDSVWPN